MTVSNRFPTLFLPHGGGPCFFLDPGEVFPAGMWDDMAAYLKGIATTLDQRPKALLVVSGHWEEPMPTTYGPPSTSLLYDYYGFPKKTYQLKYPAPGDPQLASKVKTLLNSFRNRICRKSDPRIRSWRIHSSDARVSGCEHPHRAAVASGGIGPIRPSCDRPRS